MKKIPQGTKILIKRNLGNITPSDCYITDEMRETEGHILIIMHFSHAVYGNGEGEDSPETFRYTVEGMGCLVYTPEMFSIYKPTILLGGVLV